MNSSDFSTYAETRDYLYSLKHRGAFYGIDRMRKFTERLGSPQLKYPTIHVAGTNGKGSTCAMLEAVFRYHGFKTGMFTSPHLVHQGERVQINRENLSHEKIVSFTNQLRPIAENLETEFPDMHPTFFEFMTGMAFLRFAEADVDVAIIETGLGGRLDATNVLEPEICVITSIGFDHTEILGETLEEIAAEKAGILKAGVPLVLGCIPEIAASVIRNRGKGLNCPVYEVNEYYGENRRPLPQTNLKGEYQRRNAAVVMLVVKILGEKFALDPTKATRALQNVSWAGRWDVRRVDGRTVIFDATHNPEGALELDRNLSDFINEQGVKPIILAGTLGEPRAAALMPVLAKHAHELILVKPKQPRACDFQTLKKFIPKDFGGKIIEGDLKVLFPKKDQIALLDRDRPLVITGSIYLIGEILDALSHDHPVGEQILQD